MLTEQHIVRSDVTLENCIANIRLQYAEHGYLSIESHAGKTRSLTQNSALHKYCELLAVALNDAGLDMMKVMKPGADIPWSKESVKELLWRPIQNAMTGKQSTTEQTKAEYVDIYEVLNRHMAAKFGVSVPWPVKKDV